MTLHLFHVRVHLAPLRPPEALAPEDRDDPFLCVGGHMDFDVAAPDSRSAIDVALDAFSSTVPIGVLEEFDIEGTTAGPASAHAHLAAMPLTEGVLAQGPPVRRDHP